MRVLITGAEGMLGNDLSRIFSERHSVVRTDIAEMDVRDPSVVFRVVQEAKPDWVVHLAAATDVDECERDPDLAYHTNAIGTRNVALASRQVGATLVYLSTVSVFDGHKCEPFTEFDPPNPQSTYSRSKYHGEHFVRDLVPEHYIVRAGWMFGGHTRDKKFVAKIVSLAQERPVLQVVNDKFGSPTYTVDLSRGLLKLIETGLYGTYHMVGTGGFCSRFEFAQAILDAAGISSCRLEPVASARFPLAAPRPRMEAAINYHLQLMGMQWMRPWREALIEYVNELVEQDSQA